MYFLEMFGKTTDILKSIYKDNEIFKCQYFGMDNFKFNRGSLTCRIYLPIPKNPPKKVIEKEQNIVTMGIDIFIDGQFKIDKYYAEGKDELEIFKIDVAKLDEKRYSIVMHSNDNTYIYIETSYLTASFGFGCVENWYAKEIEKLSL